MTIGNPAFTAVHIRDKLQLFDHVGKKTVKCQPIKTWEIAVSDCKTNYMN